MKNTLTALLFSIAIVRTLFAHEIQAANDAPTKLNQIADYVKNELIGKTFSVETTVGIDEGKIETEFNRNATYSNLFSNETVIRFDELISIEQTTFELGDGKRKLPGVLRDRVLVIRHEYWQSESTGEVIGFAQTISNTMSSSSVPTRNTIQLEDNQLKIVASTVGYADLFEAGGGYYPGAIILEQVFDRTDSKLQRTDSTTVFRVDPDTRKRTRTSSPVEVLENTQK